MDRMVNGGEDGGRIEKDRMMEVIVLFVYDIYKAYEYFLF